MNVNDLHALADLVAPAAGGAGDDERHARAQQQQQQQDGAHEDRPNNPFAGTDALFPVVIKSGKQLRSADQGDTTSSSSSAAVTASAPVPTAAVAAPLDPKAIWADDELETTTSLAHLDDADGRKKPDFEIAYKQHVTSEDVFLNAGTKDPSSASCDHLVVKIVLPDTRYEDVVLDVIDTQILVRTPLFKLFSYLPHTINSSRGRAQWDAPTCTLRLTLPIVE